MVLLPTIAASFVLLMAPKDGWLKAKDAPTLDQVTAESASHESPAVRAKRERGAGLFGSKQSRKAQLLHGVEPASRGRSAPQELEVATEAASVEDAQPAVPRASYLCPEGMVMVGQKFCVDVYEAALLEVLDGGEERPRSPFMAPKPGVKLRAFAAVGQIPQGYISGVQARAACEASGKRLCKPEEWKKACMGPKETIWPYGADHKANVCNDHGRSSMHFFNPGLTDKPEDRWKWGAGGNMMDPRLNQLDGTLAKTGDHPGCTNEYGVYDMVGNLHEWVDDPDGTFQGGYYLDTHLNADGCYYRTTAHDMKHADYSTGFRCCADVESM